METDWPLEEFPKPKVGRSCKLSWMPTLLTIDFHDFLESHRRSQSFCGTPIHYCLTLQDSILGGDRLAFVGAIGFLGLNPIGFEGEKEDDPPHHHARPMWDPFPPRIAWQFQSSETRRDTTKVSLVVSCCLFPHLCTFFVLLEKAGISIPYWYTFFGSFDPLLFVRHAIEGLETHQA